MHLSDGGGDAVDFLSIGSRHDGGVGGGPGRGAQWMRRRTSLFFVLFSSFLFFCCCWTGNGFSKIRKVERKGRRKRNRAFSCG